MRRWNRFPFGKIAARLISSGMLTMTTSLQLFSFMIGILNSTVTISFFTNFVGGNTEKISCCRSITGRLYFCPSSLTLVMNSPSSFDGLMKATASCLALMALIKFPRDAAKSEMVLSTCICF
jgi:hypothetical protein